MMDTRLITAASDVKAAAAALDDGHLSAAKAAIDDARTALWELLSEGPKMSPRDRHAVDESCGVLNKLLTMPSYPALDVLTLDAVYGSLTRIADRWTA